MSHGPDYVHPCVAPTEIAMLRPFHRHAEEVQVEHVLQVVHDDGAEVHDGVREVDEDVGHDGVEVDGHADEW